MATSIADLITSVRYRLVDPNGTDYSDGELFEHLRDANRAVHSTVARIKPELVRYTQTGNTVSGTASISLTGGDILQGLAVTVKSRRLDNVSPDLYSRDDETGEPRSYWCSGFDTVDLYPTPDGVFPYTVSYIPQPTDITADGNSSWPVMFDPFLVEFATARAGLRNEADMTQEASFMSNWQQKIIEALSMIDQGTGQVRGYW